MATNFEDSSEFGKLGEKAGIEILQGMFDASEIKDVSLDKEYQKIDVDLIINHNNKEYKVEIKTDKTYHKNLFLEIVSSFERNTLGWFAYTEADYLFYGFSESGDVYLIPILELRGLTEENSFCEKEAKENVGQNIKTSIGIIVPLSYVSEYKIGNYKEIYNKHLRKYKIKRRQLK